MQGWVKDPLSEVVTIADPQRSRREGDGAEQDMEVKVGVRGVGLAG